MAVLVSDWYELDDIREDDDEIIILANDLDSTTSGYDELASETANDGSGWDPIDFDDFTGEFRGRNNTIKDFYVNRPDENDVGLFGRASCDDAIFENFSIENATVDGRVRTGILFGELEGGFTCRNVEVEGSVTYRLRLGGVFAGEVITAIVDGPSLLEDVVCRGSVNIQVDGSEIDADDNLDRVFAGGFVGRLELSGTAQNLIADVDITGGYEEGNEEDTYLAAVGGFAGFYNPFDSESANFAIGDINVDAIQVGGFAGNNSNVSDCFSLGDVTGIGEVGGFVGLNGGGPVFVSGELERVYSTGSVTAVGDDDDYTDPEPGGLIGRNGGGFGTSVAEESYWDVEASGISTAIGDPDDGDSMDLVGLDTAEMQGPSAESNMEFLDFSIMWRVVDGSNENTTEDFYPIFRSIDEFKQLTILERAQRFLDVESQDADIADEYPLVLDQRAFENWSFEGRFIGRVIEEIRGWDFLELVIRYREDDSSHAVDKLRNASGKVDVREIESGGFRGVDLAEDANTFKFEGPRDRRNIRSVTTWLLDEASREPADKDANQYDLEIRLIPEKEKMYDGRYGTLDSEVSQTRQSSEWGFNFGFGSIATDKVTVNVNEENDGTIDIKEVEMILSRLQTRVVEENLGFLNEAIIRNVPDNVDVVDDVSFGDRNTVSVIQPDGADGPISNGDYVCVDWEVEWLSGAYRVELSMAEVTQ